MQQKIFLIFLIINLTKSEIIQLPHGQILGYKNVTPQNTEYYAFEGVPFAKPPIKELRFKPPVPSDNWEGVLNCTNYKKICMQIFSDQSVQTEDCLYINIYTPKLQNGTIALPVMVFVYGGQFINGYPQQYQPDLFLNKDIIVVTFNYRVGIFGFLTTEDDAIPPNNGLKDQQLAMAWVKKNIHLFGGDPSKITIFGQSAGAASISYQLLNPNNKDLFSAIILESGTFLNLWSLQRNARERAFSTGKTLNLFKFLFSNDSQELLKYLQEINVDKLQKAANTFQGVSDIVKVVGTFEGYNWAPVIEKPGPNAVLTEKQFGLLKSGTILKVPTLMGINSEEGLAFFQIPALLELVAGTFDLRSDWLVPIDMKVPCLLGRIELGLEIKKIYTNGLFALDPSAALRFISDNFLTRPNIKFAELYSKFAKTYFYEYAYDGVLGHLQQQYDGTEHVGHSQELYYTMCLNSNCNGSTISEADLKTRDRLVELWTNFAKYRNPTPSKSELLQNVEWPILDTSGGDFFYLNINETLEVRNHPKNDTFPAWEKLYAGLQDQDFDTY